MNNKAFYHKPVLVQEVIDLLGLKPGMVVVDCTVGLAGHAQVIMEKIGDAGVFLGVDRDKNAIEVSKEKLKEYKVKKYLVNDSFANLTRVFSDIGLGFADVFLFDLGVSSYQIDAPERGFSFLTDSQIDMRFDSSSSKTAAYLVNSMQEKELADIIYEYGEERFAKRIARAIAESRNDGDIVSTVRLSEIIRKAVPMKYRRGRLHPATRTFQALRIAVNDELNAIEKGLACAKELLSEGGRIGVISFHSLEDRIVKRTFRKWKTSGQFNILTKKPVRPSSIEIADNPRSRSSKFRVCEKISLN